MTTAAELLAVLRADDRQFAATIARDVRMTRSLETSASRFSKVAKAGFTVVGAAVAKAVTDFVRFESTMTKLATLGGAASSEIQGLSRSVLSMARDVATGPQELAEGLYFVYSAGIKGSAAMETLEYSAKGAALGLGTVETVADAVTSVLNAYGTANIDAARATAILREAVEQSKREADEIAGAIGRVLPIASEMGVEFEQVAGAIAAMTRTGLDANEAVTALRGVLVGILDPTERAEKTLRNVGLSVEDLQNALRSGNVVDVLLQLKDAFGENERAIGQVFPNVRALVGVLSLVGDNAKAAQQAFEGVADATVSDLNEAFSIFAGTAEGKLRTAWASIQSGLIEVGGALAPVVKLLADLVAIVGPAVKYLLPLAAAIVAVKLASAGLAAVAGPAALGIVNMINAAKTAGSVFTAWNQGMISGKQALAGLRNIVNSSISPTLAWAAASLLAAEALNKLVAFTKLSDEFAAKWAEQIGSGAVAAGDLAREVDRITGDFISPDDVEVIQGFTESLELNRTAIREQNQEILAGTGIYKTWGGVLDDVSSRNLRLHGNVATLLLDLKTQGLVLSNLNEKTVRQKIASGDLEGAIRILSGVLGLGKGKTDDLASATDELAGAHARAAEKAREQKAAEAKLAGGLLGILESIKGVREQQDALTELRKDGKKGTQEYRDAQADLLGSQLELNESLKTYLGDLRKSGQPQDVAVGKVVALGRQVGLTKKEVLEILGPLARYKNRWEDINRLPNIEKSITTTFRTHGKATGFGGGIDTGQLEGHSGGYLRRHRGGAIERLHGGGFGRLRSDERPAILQVGEFVMQRRAVRALGVPLLRALNEGREALAKIATPKEAHDWFVALAREWRKPGISRKEEALIANAIAAIREVRGSKAADRYRETLEKLSGGRGLTRRFRLTHEGFGLNRAEAAANAFALSRREHDRPAVKVQVRPDRRRFGRDLGYDWLTRGW